MHEPLQSAYRSNHSVETALLRVSNDLLLAIDGKKCIFLTLLDSSAAFDTIDYAMFLKRMEQENGISGKLIEWLRSYFTDKSQEVHVEGHSSVKMSLSTCFPQESRIGRLVSNPSKNP